MHTMSIDAFARCRVSAESKALLQSIAAREQITESALVRQLLETLLRTSATESPTSGKSDDAGLRAERTSIRLSPYDRLFVV